MALSCSVKTMTFTLDLDSAKLVFDSTWISQGFVRVKLDCNQSGVAIVGGDTDYGAPVVPKVKARVVLPQRVRVTQFASVAENAESVPGSFRLLPRQRLVPPPTEGVPKQWHFDSPIREICNSVEPYPGLSTNGGQHSPSVNEFNTAWATVHPVQYIPKEGKLTFYRRFRLTLSVVPDTSALDPHGAQLSEDVKSLIESGIRDLVINPEDVSRFAPW